VGPQPRSDENLRQTAWQQARIGAPGPPHAADRPGRSQPHRGGGHVAPAGTS